MKNLRLLLFTLVALIQLSVPLYMAWHWENILQAGQPFYWQTTPVDPADAFKGRYIDLNFKAAAGPVAPGSVLHYGQTAYALIAQDQAGRAVISQVSATQPPNQPYVKVKINYIEENTIAHVHLPFKRYYLPEALAPAAEAAYQKNTDNTVAVIRLQDGYGVIEQVYIGDQTLADYLQNPQP